MNYNRLKKIYCYFKNNGILSIFFGFIILVFLLYIFDIGCPIRYMTGISCPGCGMTRAVDSLIHCDIKMAFHYHPLIFFLPIIGIVFFFKDKIYTNIFNVIIIIFIIIFIAVYIIRLIDPNNNVVYIDFKHSFIYKIISKILKAP